MSVEILGLHLRTPTPFIVDGEINIEKDDGDAMSRMNGAAARARDAGWPNKMQPGAPGPPDAIQTGTSTKKNVTS